MRLATTAATRSLQKADFSEIYRQPDPRAYYQTLGALGYEIPHHGQQVFRALLDHLDRRPATVVDVCCSYGVNAALLTTDLTLDDLYERYRSPALADLTSAELAAADAAHYAAHRRDDAPRVIGLDASAPAIAYALDAGVLSAGAAEDLERRAPSRAVAAAAADADLITVTGGIGYVTEATIARLVDCAASRRPPTVAALCLRTVPYDGIAAALGERGLVTEKLAGTTFPQRRFADDAEREYALRELAARGLDASSEEADGAYHAELYVSRPAAEATARPLDSLLGR